MSDFTNYLRVNKQIEKSIRKSEEKKAIKRLEEKIIYSETSEEYKAIKWLENKTTNYSDNSLVLHYNNILYYLIINLMKEKQQLKEKIKTYEDPEDLTLMFMYCDEKAKDKIKQLKEVIEEVRELRDQFIDENELSVWENDSLINFVNKLLQILDKAKENK